MVITIENNSVIDTKLTMMLFIV